MSTAPDTTTSSDTTSLPDTAKSRLEVEASQLEEKLKKLSEFLKTDIFKGLNKPQRQLLESQHVVMHTYLTILEQRILLF
jgi:hypothetical protein